MTIRVFINGIYPYRQPIMILSKTRFYPKGICVGVSIGRIMSIWYWFIGLFSVSSTKVLLKRVQEKMGGLFKKENTVFSLH